MNNPVQKKLLSITEILTTGGDSRIMLSPETGFNKYGCPPFPEPEVFSFGSVTASTISAKGFASVERLYGRLSDSAKFEPPHTTYVRELERVRAELVSLCELQTIPGLEIIFAASGTDAHLFAAQLVRKNDSPLTVITLEPEETGSGVPAALCGKIIKTESAIEVIAVHAREKDGNLRAQSTIDAEIELHATANIKSERNVLLVLTDVSKTGLIFPSIKCVTDLHKKFPAKVDVLVDACQLRLGSQALRAYLEQDFLVAITGSKFITGPAFSGALLVPKTLAQKFRSKVLPSELGLYSAAADWPKDWDMQNIFPATANYGLLLRWEAALEELRAFHALSSSAIKSFVQDFHAAISERIASDNAFEPLPTDKLNRNSVTEGWDAIPTIFPFLLCRNGKELLNREETKRVYELMGKDPQRCQIGQPVACGTRNGIPISALRLCNSARLIVDAVSKQGRGAEVVIKEAMQVLDKAAMLASRESL